MTSNFVFWVFDDIEAELVVRFLISCLLLKAKKAEVKLADN